MARRWLAFFLMASILSTASFGQELSVSTAAKTYAAGEQIWVGLSVIHSAALPGAFKITINYNAEKVRFVSILPAKQGPFAVSPAAAVSGGSVTIAGFQGIADTGQTTISLATAVFTPASGPALVDTSSFTISSKEVYSAQAQPMDLKVTKQATSVLLASVERNYKQRISLANNYLRFTVFKEGMTSVRIFDLNGRVCAAPLAPSPCKAGYHAVPVGARLRTGVYIVAVRGAGFSASEKLEVVR